MGGETGFYSVLEESGGGQGKWGLRLLGLLAGVKWVIGVEGGPCDERLPDPED